MSYNFMASYSIREGTSMMSYSEFRLVYVEYVRA